MKLSEAFRLYIDEHLFMKNAARETIYHYEHCREVAVTFFGDIDVAKLTLNDIRHWEGELLQDRSYNTVRGYIMQLRCVLKYCRIRGFNCIESSIIPVAKRKVVEMSNVSPEEVDRLIDSSPRLRTKFVIAFLYASGIRVSEFCALNRDSIVDRRFTVIGKGNKERLCFIDERAELYMKAYLSGRTDSCEALLVCQKHKVERVTRGTVQIIVKNAVRDAGLTKRITPHTFRHGFATGLVKNGAPMPAVSKLLGHASVATTMIYTHFANPALQDTYERFHQK